MMSSCVSTTNVVSTQIAQLLRGKRQREWTYPLDPQKIYRISCTTYCTLLVMMMMMMMMMTMTITMVVMISPSRSLYPSLSSLFSLSSLSRPIHSLVPLYFYPTHWWVLYEVLSYARLFRTSWLCNTHMIARDKPSASVQALIQMPRPPASISAIFNIS